MPNAPRDTSKNYGPQSPKFPNAGALDRNKMAPDVSSDSMRPFPAADLGPNDEKCQGSNPSTPGVTVSPIAASPDSKHVPGRSGDAGPM